MMKMPFLFGAIIFCSLILGGVISIPFGVPIGIMIFEAGIILTLLFYGIWLGLAPLIEMTKKRESPGLYATIAKVRKDGQIYFRSRENPKVVSFESKDKEKEALGLGTQIVSTYHRDGDFGNPVHIVLEDELENTNLWTEKDPSNDSKLLDATVIEAHHAGIMKGRKEVSSRENALPMIQIMFGILTIIACIVAVYFSMQNHELLIAMQSSLETIAKNTTPLVGRIVEGA